MTVRAPSRTLVVDTNILVGMALGNSGRARTLTDIVLKRRAVIISERARDEAEKVTHSMLATRPGIHQSLAIILDLLEHRPAAIYAQFLEAAGETLRLAVSSRNGNTSDDHVLALAWAAEADIWSADRDFAGTGWPSWSTANLVRALAQEPVPALPAVSDDPT